jgi:hypothetical protein
MSSQVRGTHERTRVGSKSLSLGIAAIGQFLSYLNNAIEIPSGFTPHEWARYIEYYHASLRCVSTRNRFKHLPGKKEP